MAGKPGKKRPKGANARKSGGGKSKGKSKTPVTVGQAPRIGFETVGKRFATVWSANPGDVTVKGVTAAGIVSALDKAEALVETEEKARKNYLSAAADYEGIHDQRVGYVKAAWSDFVAAIEHVRLAAKRDDTLVDRYDFVYQFMANKKRKLPPTDPSK